MNENINGYTPTPEDNKKMESLLNQAKDILLKQASRSIKNKDSEAPIEKREDSLSELNKKLLDNKSDFLTNVEKGDNDEIFFRTLAEEIPDLGLFVDEEAEANGELLPNYIAIKTTPFKTDRQFIFDLLHHPIITLLENSAKSWKDKEELGVSLEKEGLLPKGTTDRLLSKDYKYKIIRHPDLKQIFEERYAKYKNLEPLSDEEIKEFMRKVI